MSWLHACILLVGIFLGVFGFGFLYLVMRMVQVFRGEQSRRRQTQATEAGLLDTMADLNHMEFNLIEIQGRLDTIYRQVALARERQGVIRRGPYEYPKDGRLEVDDVRD